MNPPERSSPDQNELDQNAPDQNGTPRGSVPEPSRQQVLEWAACGLVAAAARFVPVPLLDDLIKDRVTLLAVSRTLRAHGRDYPLDLVEPLVDPQGLRRGLLARLRSVPRRLLLFPVRKYVAIARLVRSGPADVLGVVLLARSVDRALHRGLLAGPDAAVLDREAVAVRRAYEDAVRNADLRIVAGALADGLAGATELGRSAVDLGRRLLARDGSPDEDAGTVVEATRDEGPLRDGAVRVEESLRRPEVVARLARFDAGFDAGLARYLGSPPR